MLGSVGSLNRLGANGRNVYGPSGASLWLDFTASDTLDSRITFSRGSQATLFDSNGVLRYAKHNLLLQSQTFQTTWTAARINVSSDAITAPDGTITADKLIVTSVAGSHTISQNVSITPQAYTFSLYAKKGEYDFVQLNIPDPGAGGAGKVGSFNIATGTLGAVQDAGVTRTITAVGDGWYRCTVTFTPTGAGSSAIGIFVTQTDVRAQSFTGNDVSGIFTWGAQLNLSNMEGGVTESLDTYYPTTTAAFYAGRARDYNPSTLAPNGFLIEEQRTNSIRNNTMQGAVAGTPGTLPTNWGTNSIGTLTQEVVGTGVSNGISYVDIRYSGTTSTSSLEIRLEAVNGIAASNGQTWAASVYTAVVGGSLSNITGRGVNANLSDSGSNFLASLGFNVTWNTSSTLTRSSNAATIATASTAFIRPLLFLQFSSGVAIDITLRIGLPQLELGATATSVIPTSGTALTRNADVASMTGTNFSSWFNAAEGTLYAEYNIPFDSSSSIFPVIAGFSDGTFNNTVINYQRSVDDSRRGNIRTLGVQQFDAGNNSAYVYGTNTKQALAYAANNIALSVAGAAPTTNASASIPAINQMGLGSNGFIGGALTPLNGWLQRIAYYPARLANATLQVLTT